MEVFIQLLISSLETGSVYSLAALGVILIFKTSGLTNFAQGVMGMFNAYVATLILMKTGIPAFLSALIAMIIAVIFGILIDFLIIRRAEKVPLVSKQIITFGMIMLILGITPIIFGTSPLNFPKFINSGSFNLLNTTITFNAILNIILGLIILTIVFLFLQKTRWGLAVRVTATDANNARLMGIPTKLVTMGAWAIAAALGTLSALMLAPSNTVNVMMMENVQLNALIACVLGGFQTFYGPVIGSYIISFANNILRFYISSTWGNAIVYILILVFIIFRPNGIIGKKFIKKV